MTTLALQRLLLGSFSSSSFLMYCKEETEKKECGKDKDQTNKNTLKINDGVSRGCPLLGKNTLLCSKLNSTQRSVILSQAVKLQGTPAPCGRQTRDRHTDHHYQQPRKAHPCRSVSGTWAEQLAKGSRAILK